MAHHKSAKKRILTSAKKREINKSVISKLKTLTNKVMSSDKVEEVTKFYNEAVAYTDKVAAKGIIHKNTAARRKSALTKHLNSFAVPEVVAEKTV